MKKTGRLLKRVTSVILAIMLAAGSMPISEIEVLAADFIEVDAEETAVEETAVEESEDSSPVEPVGSDLFGYRKTDIKAPYSYNYEEGDGSIQAELPDSYDSREQNVISGIKNQNPYGTCWAHSALAAMEASMASKSYETNSVDYSERHLVWFAYHSKDAADPLKNVGDDYTELKSSEYGDEIAFDFGGNQYTAAFPLLRWQGAAWESDFPYSSDTLSIRSSEAYSSNSHLQNVFFINMSQQDRVKSAIMRYGALEIDYFHNDVYYNYKNAAYYCNENMNGANHAVTVIGWDDDYSKGNFSNEPLNNGAWLVKNSWGTYWGNQGYMWISYEDINLKNGVATVYDAEAVNNYDKNYFYDGTNIQTNWYVSNASNVFTAQENETLKAVGIMLEDADVSYGVEIYKNPDDNNPQSGELLLSQEGRTSYAGYYTIPLDKEVALTKGDKFSVVFSFSNNTWVYVDSSGDTYICDSNGKTVATETFHSVAKQGQSYYKYDSQYCWTDLNYSNASECEGRNIRIHAYTDVDGTESDNTPTSIRFADELTEGKLNIGVGEYYSTQVVISPTNAKPDLLWTSSDETVVKVDVKGGITGVSEGTATITATSVIDSSISASITVNVIPKLQSIGIDFDNVKLTDNGQAKYSVNPISYKPEKAPEWTSNNEKVLKIDKDGNLEPVHVGKATVSLTIDDVTVTKNVSVISDYIEPEYKLLYSGAVKIDWDSKPGADYYRVLVNDNSERVIKEIQENNSGHYSVVDDTFSGKKELSKSQTPYGGIIYYCSSFSNAILEDGTTEAWEWRDYSDNSKNNFFVSLSDFNNRTATVCYHDVKEPYSEHYITYSYGDGDLISSYLEFDDFTIPSGKEFYGWNTEPDGSGVSVLHGDSVDTSIGDLVKNAGTIDLYPQFADITVDDVTSSLDEATVDSGSRITLSTTTDGSEIFFTLDGTDIAIDSAIEGKDVSNKNAGTYKYTDSVLLVNDNTESEAQITVKLRAIAVKDGVKSKELVKEYTITSAGNENKIPTGLWVYGLPESGEYQGSAMTFPDMKVYYHKNPLKLNVDYSVKYKNNKNAGMATVTITGKGSYFGQVSKNFNITKRSISSTQVTVSDMLYNKRAQTPSITVKDSLNGKTVTLRKGTDYIIEYETAKMIEPGTYNVTISGKGNYDENTTVSVKMIDAISMNAVSASKVANQKYTGTDITIKSIGSPFAVTYKKKPLKMGEDGHYTISYSNNKEIGKATIKLIGTGKPVDGITVVGEKNISFNIVGTALSKASFSGSLVSVTYKGTEWKMGDNGQNTLSLYIKATKTTPQKDLVQGTDYEIEYSNNVKAGTAKVIFKGINAYSGTVTKTFKIYPYDIQKDTEGRIAACLESYEVTYAKGGVRPSPSVGFKDAAGNSMTMVEKTDYTLGYANNTSVNDGTNVKKRPTVKITGKGNYKGTISVNFTIIAQDIGRTVISADDVVYKNAAGNYKAAVTLYDLNGKKLASNSDYDKNIEYTYAKDTLIRVKSGKKLYNASRRAGQTAMPTDIVPAGTIMNVSVNGKGNYCGNTSCKFRIGQISINKATISISPQQFTGKSIKPSRRDLKVTYGSKNNLMILDYDDYEIVSYGTNLSGTGTIVIRGINDFCGYKTIKFKINAQNISN